LRGACAEMTPEATPAIASATNAIAAVCCHRASPFAMVRARPDLLVLLDIRRRAASSRRGSSPTRTD
jgi:hypothetical protein